jgi:prepilin peptidase CpaA
MTNFNPSQLVLLIFPIFLLTGAIFDALTLRIPNRFNLFGLILFVPIAWLVGLSFDDMLIHLLVGFCLLLLSFGAYAAGIFGGGDSKFFAVIGLWLGYQPLPEFLFYTGLVGGILSLFIMIGGRFIPVQWQPAIFQTMLSKKVVPYGTAMSIAALLVYQNSPFWVLLMS